MLVFPLDVYYLLRGAIRLSYGPIAKKLACVTFGILGCSWGVLGKSWGAFGGLGGLLEGSWGVLGWSWGVLGLLGRSWTVLGRSWVGLGEVLCGLWGLLASSCLPLLHQRPRNKLPQVWLHPPKSHLEKL